MATRLKNLDRDTPMLLPPDLRDWVREDHIVHFLIDAVDRLPTEGFSLNQRGTGDEQYPPRMMLSLLIYCYATGRFSSRVIEEATWSDVVVRYICGGTMHPDHDTICTFRRKNRKLFEKAFVEVLLMAQETAGLKKVGTVSIDGTKIKANASKHAAVSYQRAGEQIELLRKEVEQLTAKAEEIDNVPLDEGLSIPKEIARREDRIKSLEHAREVIKERYAEERKEKQADYEEKMARREEKRRNGERRGRRPPSPPPEEPPGSMQYNFTDPESRIMKTGGSNFEQAFNAQAAVDTDTLLVVGQLLTDAPTDKQQLNPVLNSVPEEVAQPEAALADSGYYGAEAIEKAESNHGPTVYCSLAKSGHRITVADLERKPLPETPPPDAPIIEQMAYRLQTPEGKARYKLRKQTVEPVFGVIKEVLGFRRFSMRGKQKAETEWCLVCLSYNLKKLFNLTRACAPERPSGAKKKRVHASSASIRASIGTYMKKLATYRLHRRQLPRDESPIAVLCPTGC